jgi:carbamoyltransferase
MCKMNILSIHYGHDSSACILKNGDLVLYFKEERLSRKKRDQIPYLSIKNCLENFEEEITHIIITSCNYTIAFEYIVKFISCFIELPEENNIFDLTTCHHLSHVGSSFFNSEFDESLVVVVDGRGSTYKNKVAECESVYAISYENGVSPIIKNYSTFPYMKFDYLTERDKKELQNVPYECNIVDGAVKTYITASLLIGQTLNDGGKVMGLSSYGDRIKGFPKLFQENLTKEYKNYQYKNGLEFVIFDGHEDKITKEVDKNNYKFYADYAYEMQNQTQLFVSDLIRKSIDKTGIKNVCISGGYGMNIVANSFYREKFPDVNFFFDPICDDTGVSIGAAKIFWFLETRDKTKRPLKTTFFHGVSHDVSNYRGDTADVKQVAKLLHHDKSVAIYNGKSEVGQRALGNRSILFNALNPDAKEIVNRIKKREWYRPFAAMVLEEDAHYYFEDIVKNEFMTMCFKVKNNIIPGVTHVDGTCRVQTVSKKNTTLYQILKEFKKLSNHGILLNTSFNLAGDPLVESPQDAFMTLKETSIDYLWFEETKQIFKNI